MNAVSTHKITLDSGRKILFTTTTDSSSRLDVSSMKVETENNVILMFCFGTEEFLNSIACIIVLINVQLDIP
ncbi:CLUMA_CG007600, isoform A [Clunio marinus]|uniref:CLUMA_CG007600, isoform A n=1 Tax=Clunio marinus TaxID=568069 RepID=A0A1J1I1C1_9DIPT|nr:CLUMA_CG007600, isoform A [Clunio marinus]